MATKTYYEPKEEAVPWLVGIDMQKFICGYGANFIGSSYVSCVGIGCQQQWGASGYAVTFPIAFNVVYNVLSIPQTTASTSNAYWGRFYITALTKNGFNVSDTGAGSNRWIAIGSAQPQWGFSVTLSFESQLYYQHYPISFTVGPFTNILTTVSDEVNGVVYAPTTVNWYKDKFGIVCDYYSNGANVKPTSVTFISLGI